MNVSMRILGGLALLLSTQLLLNCEAAAGDDYPPLGNTVDHYALAPSVQRAAGGPAIYPAGVSDPARSNPPGPPPEGAIPAPAASFPANAISNNRESWADPGPPVLTPVGPPGPVSPYPGAASAVSWNAPPVIQTQVYPTVQAAPNADALIERSWYTRIEYYHWNERIEGKDFVNEDGSLFTLGYERQNGIERYRGELFGGDVHYDGYGQDASGNPLTMPSNTGYLGLRGEYELVLAPAAWQGRWALLGGVGTRFWIRDLHDGTDSAGDQVYGYQETWWTIYPYLGLESHLPVASGLDLYTESRAGVTALTYQFVSINERPLWPGVGVFANAEMGLRGQKFFLAARAEVMNWTQSSTVQGSLQPQSLLVTVGLRMGIMF